VQLEVHMKLFPVGQGAELRTWSDIQWSLDVCSKEGSEQSAAKS